MPVSMLIRKLLMISFSFDNFFNNNSHFFSGFCAECPYPEGLDMGKAFCVHGKKFTKEHCPGLITVNNSACADNGDKCELAAEPAVDHAKRQIADPRKGGKENGWRKIYVAECHHETQIPENFYIS